jgi:hypothetical protein
MKIEVQRSGGFAGITMTFSVDETSVTVPEASQLEELVEKAAFFDLSSSNIPIKKPGADYYSYNITIDMRGKRHNVKVTDLTISKDLRSVINLVMEIQKRSLHK